MKNIKSNYTEYSPFVERANGSPLIAEICPLGNERPCSCSFRHTEERGSGVCTRARYKKLKESSNDFKKNIGHKQRTEVRNEQTLSHLRI